MPNDMDINPEMIMDRAAEVDVAADAATEAALPEGEYTPKGLKPLASAINAILPLFKAPPVKLPIDAITGQLPIEYMRPLEMIASALADSQVEGFELDPGMIVDDMSAIEAASNITALSKNSEFKSFLRSAEKPVVKEPVVEKEAPVEINPKDIDSLMMSRM